MGNRPLEHSAGVSGARWGNKATPCAAVLLRPDCCVRERDYRSRHPLCLRLGVGLARDGRITDACQGGADDRGDPEQPKLGDRPTPGDQGRTGAAGRIDRQVCDRDADQVDQGQPEADSEGCSLFSPRVYGGFLMFVLSN